ncbi:MAG: hypothetical protein R3268_09640, partial [Acidiferrobacterales bacterium]|nr:hypothetical protein [Acidiferrobacterales bacterium]
ISLNMVLGFLPLEGRLVEDELRLMRERCATAAEEKAEELISDSATMAIAVQLVKAVRSVPINQADQAEQRRRR